MHSPARFLISASFMCDTAFTTCGGKPSRHRCSAATMARPPLSEVAKYKSLVPVRVLTNSLAHGHLWTSWDTSATKFILQSPVSCLQQCCNSGCARDAMCNDGPRWRPQSLRLQGSLRQHRVLDPLCIMMHPVRLVGILLRSGLQARSLFSSLLATCDYTLLEIPTREARQMQTRACRTGRRGNSGSLRGKRGWAGKVLWRSSNKERSKNVCLPNRRRTQKIWR